MNKVYCNFTFKPLFYLVMGIFFLNVPILQAATLNSQISALSNTIINNRVQIKLIESYINNITESYNIKLKSLKHKYKEFSTSIAILYKLKTTPKEILLVANLTKEQTLNIFVVTNYWLKTAYNNISKMLLELENIQKITKELNQAKHLLNNLNVSLISNQKNLNTLLKKNKLENLDIDEVNKIRALLKYNSTISNENLKLFAKIDHPILTKDEKEKNKLFIKNNKGKMLWPTNGTIYSDYQSNKYYDLTYYGIVLYNSTNNYVFAPAEGEIIFCDTIGKYNNIIMIKHAPSYVSMICGELNFNVKLSQKIKKGDLIASISSLNSKIYFELNYLCSPINPTDWLTTFNKE